MMLGVLSHTGQVENKVLSYEMVMAVKDDDLVTICCKILFTEILSGPGGETGGRGGECGGV